MLRGSGLRPDIWAQIWDDAKAAPIAGHGLISPISVEAGGEFFGTAHNAYLQVFWQGGVIGLGLFLAVLAGRFSLCVVARAPTGRLHGFLHTGVHRLHNDDRGRHSDRQAQGSMDAVLVATGDAAGLPGQRIPLPALLRAWGLHIDEAPVICSPPRRQDSSVSAITRRRWCRAFHVEPGKGLSRTWPDG